MKRRAAVAAIAGWAAALGGVLVPETGLAFRAPAQRPAADHDSRREARAGAAAPISPAPTNQNQVAALDSLRHAVKNVRIRWDAALGVPTRIGALSGTLTGASAQAPVDIVLDYLRRNRALFNLSEDDLREVRFSRDFVTADTGVRHLTVQQQVDGRDVFGAEMRANVDRFGRILDVGGALVPDVHRGVDPSPSSLTAEEAISIAAADALLSDLGSTAASGLVLFPLGPGHVRLAHDVTVDDARTPNRYRSLVDAQDGTVLWRRNLTAYAHAAAHGPVFKSDGPDPDTPTGTSSGLVARVDLGFNGLGLFPHADPHADWWNGSGQPDRNTTISNNVVAQEDRDGDDAGGFRPTAGPGESFAFPLDLSQDPSLSQSAAIVNLFFWNNLIHDVFYRLGFDEPAGNFQRDNFGLGGAGGDPVRADAQDARDDPTDPPLCNANFGTPGDGSSPRMQMYQCNFTTPERDGDLDDGVIIHEYTHGLSSRLVGDLGGSQAGGMGEGWSDFMALSLLAESGDDVDGRYELGQWLFGFGIRRQPYSTDASVFTRTYADITDGASCAKAVCSNDPTTICAEDADCGAGNSCVGRSCAVQEDCEPPSTTISQGPCQAEVHDTGEIWANTLWIARANLVYKYGFPTGGDTMERLVVDGLKLTPPKPDFLDARDAILLADRQKNGGVNQCLLWDAFARMGMGFSALSVGSEDIAPLQAFDVPSTCAPNLRVQGNFEIGAVCPGAAGTSTVSLANAGTGELIVKKFEKLAGDPEIKLRSGPELPATIGAGSHLDFVASCDANPSSAGSKLATFRAETNDPDQPLQLFTAACSTGAPDLVVDDTAAVASFPPTVEDPIGTLGCYTDRTVVLRNRGACPLRVGGATASGPFSVVSPASFPVTIAPGGASVPLTVRFRPLTGGTATAPDQVTGLLSISSNDPGGVETAGLCGEPVSRSGIRLLVLDETGGPTAEPDYVRLTSAGVLKPGPVRIHVRKPALASTTVCGQPVRYHLNVEDLVSTQTEGRFRSSYRIAAKQKNRLVAKEVNLGACEFRSEVLQTR